MKKIESLALRVKYIIDINNLSVTSAAEKCGMPQPRLNDIVLGKTINPHAKTIKRIAEGFGVTEGWLLTGQGEMRPAKVDKGKSHGLVTEQAAGWLTDEERQLVEAWRCAEDVIKEEALGMLVRSAERLKGRGGGEKNSPFAKSGSKCEGWDGR